jgi:hypothetical protein
VTIEERLYALLVPAVIDRLSELTAPQGTAVPYSAYFAVNQGPLSTHQEALVTGLREWDFQFSSFASSPLLARAETQKIVGFLTTFQDAGIRVCFLKSRRLSWDDDTKLAHSIAEFTIWEALG